MEFPQYRKLINERSFYRIESLDEFTELQQVGSIIFVHKVYAKQYPEKLKILDMLNGADPNIIDCSVTEFQSLAMAINLD